MSLTNSINSIISSGLCIGCGLCEAVANNNENKVVMQLNDEGALRPTNIDCLTTEQESLLLQICPGAKVHPKFNDNPCDDVIWGNYRSMNYAWSGDANIRYKAATAGVLTSLAIHLLKIKQVDFVLQVKASDEKPLENQWVISRSEQDVLSATGSRYAPVAPLAGLLNVLDMQQPFAIVAKPCDLSAMHNLSKIDSRVDQYCIVRMAMVCGGQSQLSITRQWLKEFGIEEKDVSLVRYRGYGNPGMTTIETKQGDVYQKTYQQIWNSPDSNWQLENRCKLCPDALGECSDIAAADVWPGADPQGEDEGFNGIIVRSNIGEELIKSAEQTGDIVIGETISTDQFNDYQPHQVRKKQVLAARFQGIAKAGYATIDCTGMRLEENGAILSEQQRRQQAQGALQRVQRIFKHES